MKKLFLSFFLSLMFVPSGFAEIYSCSHELSRFDRPGEVEMLVYARTGKFFKDDRGSKLQIINENNKIIKLNSLNKGEHFFILIIDKISLEFTNGFLSIEDSKENEKIPQTYGKCIKTD